MRKELSLNTIQQGIKDENWYVRMTQRGKWVKPEAQRKDGKVLT